MLSWCFLRPSDLSWLTQILPCLGDRKKASMMWSVQLSSRVYSVMSQALEMMIDGRQTVAKMV